MRFDLEGARKAGYSPTEIADYLGEQSQFDVMSARKAGYSDDEILSHLAPKLPAGGFVASAKQAVGATIKGAGQAAGDFIYGVDQDNALKRYGQSVVDANPTTVQSLSDIADKPLAAVAEATGNAAGSMGGMVGARVLGQGITAAAPFAGPFAPAVALAGQAVAWLGPAAIAALPSFSGIRDKQIINDPDNLESGKAKAIAALGAATVGAIETRFGPQNWALAAMTKEGRAKLAEKFASTTLTGSIAKGVGTGALIEGSEELVQNPIEQLAAGDNPTTPESLKETVFGGAMGAIGGGVLGGGVAALSGRRSDKEPDAPVESPKALTTEPVDIASTVMSTKSVDEAIQATSTAITGVPAIPSVGLINADHEGKRTAELREQGTEPTPGAQIPAFVEPAQPLSPPVPDAMAGTEPTAMELAMRAAQDKKGLINSTVDQQSPQRIDTPPVSIRPVGIEAAETASPLAPKTVAGTPAKDGDKNGLRAMGGGMAKGMTDNLYGQLFDALAQGKDTMSGIKDPVLARASKAYKAGLIKTPADLQRFENQGYPPVDSVAPYGDQTIDAATESTVEVKPPAQPAQELVPPSEQATDPLRPLVESLIKRRAAARESGIDRSVNTAIERAKAALAGGDAKPGYFSTLAKTIKGKDAATATILDQIAAHLKNPKPVAPEEKLAGFSDAEVGRRERLKQKARARKHIDVANDSIINAIAKLGGLSADHRLDITGNDKGNRQVPFVGHLFSQNGRGVDDMATSLGQYGYLTEQELGEVDGGVQALRDKIRDEFDGVQSHYSSMGEAERRANERDEAGLAEAERAQVVEIEEEVSGEIVADKWATMSEEAKDAEAAAALGGSISEIVAASEGGAAQASDPQAEPRESAEEVTPAEVRIGGYPVSGLGDKALKTAVIGAGTVEQRVAAQNELDRRAEVTPTAPGQTPPKDGVSTSAKEPPSFTIREQKSGDGVYHQIIVDGKRVGHIGGFNKGDYFDVTNTELTNESLRGSGLYQRAIQEVANKFKDGVRSLDWQSSKALSAALAKMPTYEKVGDALWVRPVGFDSKTHTNTAPDKTEGASTSDALNIRAGIEAADKVLANGADISNAMQSREHGPVTFAFGEAGDAQRQFKGGHGLSHIVAKHGRDVLDAVIQTVALGKTRITQRAKVGDRALVSYGGHTAVLSLYRNGDKETWLLTGWDEENPGGNAGEYDPTKPTPTGPTRSRADGGAGSGTIVPESGLELQGETSADLAAKAQQESAAAMKEAAAAMREAADAMREQFTLTGSARTVDEGAARGHGDLLGGAETRIGGYPVSGLGDKALQAAATGAATEAQKNAAQAELDRRANNPQKKVFTFAVMPEGDGFVLESDDGGGIVTEGRGGQLLMGGSKARVFDTREAAEAYAKKKGMPITKPTGKIEDFGSKQTVETKETDSGIALRQGQAQYSVRSPQDEYTQDLFGAPVPSPNRENRNRRPAAQKRDLDAAGAIPSFEAEQPAVIVEAARRGVLRMGFDKIDTPEKAAHAFAALRKSPREIFQILITDAKDVPIAAWDLFAGTIMQTSVYPREVLTAAYMTPGAKKVWFAHNHPSGTPQPSAADKWLTTNLAKGFGRDVGIEFAGHIIIAGNSAVAFDNVNYNDHQVPIDKIPPAARKYAIPILERTIKRQSFADRKPLNSPSAVREYFVGTEPQESGLLLVDAQHRVIGWIPVSIADMRKLRGDQDHTPAAKLFRAIGRFNPAAAIAYSTDPFDAKFADAVENIGTALSLLDVKMLDGFAPATAENRLPLSSMAERGLSMKRPGEVFFSRSDTGFAANVLDELTTYDEVFRHNRSESSDLETVFKDVSPMFKFRGEDSRADERAESGADRRYVFFTGKGRAFYLYERGRDIWLNISRLDQGDFGNYIYAAALNYAHNANKVLVGDPAGLSQDAVIRRTSAMLSSALRFGTTRHMAAAPEQVEGNQMAGITPLEWGGTDTENVRNLIDTFASTVYNKNPEIEGFRYDFDKLQFIDPDGRRVSRDRFDEAAKGQGAQGSRAGAATLQRAIFLTSLVRSESSERPGILEQVLSRGRELGSALTGLFSRTQARESGLSTEAVAKEIGLELSKAKAGKIRIAETVDGLPEKLKKQVYSKRAHDVQGVFDPKTQAIWLVSRNIPKGHAFSVLMHEGVHNGMEGLIGAKGVKRLAGQIKAWSRFAGNTEHGKLAKIATARVPSNTPKAQGDEETIAYFVEEAVKAGYGKPKPQDRGPIARWFRQLWEMVESAVKKLGADPSKLTVDDIVAMARGALERSLADRTAAAGQSARSEAPPTWYSQFERFIEEKAPNSATAEQWGQTLDSWAKQGKFKADELEWSGVREFLAMQTGKVAKADLLQFIRDNGIRVEETMLGETTADADYQTAANKAAELQEAAGVLMREVDSKIPPIRGVDRANLSFWAMEMAQGEIDAENKARAAGLNDDQITLVKKWGDARVAQANAQDIADGFKRNGNDAKYGRYTLPGGENYRELLLTLPTKQGAISDSTLSELDAALKRKGNAGIGEEERRQLKTAANGTFEMLDDWESRLDVDVSQARSELSGAETPSGVFRSSHWDQPNILAHIRFDERTDADGKKVLFIQEVQSDWGQQGKKKGFRVTPKREAELRARIAELEAFGKDASTEQKQEWAELNTELQPEKIYAGAMVPQGPFVGKTEAWLSLALKRMIRYGAENGFDRVAMVTGQQSADRYDLSKHIDSLHYVRERDGSFSFDAEKDGRTVIVKNDVPAGEVSDFVGKEVAERMARGDGSPRRGKDVAKGAKSLTDLDLKVGGEGMITFYDKIVPNVANDLLKKLGGGRVGEINLGETNERGGHYLKQGTDGIWQLMGNKGFIEAFDSKRDAESALSAIKKDVLPSQPGFDITPAMRQTAMAGMPLFSRARYNAGDERAKTAANPTPRTIAGQDADALRNSSTAAIAERRARLAAKGIPGPENPDVTPRFSRAGNRASWDAPEPGKLDKFIRVMQDKHIDTKQVIRAIRNSVGAITDAIDVYLQEELFHGRAAKRVHDFLDAELRPLFNDMAMRGVGITEFEEYLHARHAEERNEQIAKINPDMPDGGSGMDTKDARGYLTGLDAQKKRAFEALAKRVDEINTKTRQSLVDYGLESPSTIAAWGAAYKHYVPLHREDMESSPGTGQGFSVRGPATKRATGSKRAVENILAHIAAQREQAIVRGEKNRVSNAVIGLAEANPNPDFWKVDQPPKLKVVNERTGLVEERIDPLYKSRENIIVARMPDAAGNVVERSVIFNERDERASRMVEALKNLDSHDLSEVLAASAKVTRYLASINTQYNPVFGVINLTRDVQGALLNLSTTAIRGKQVEVLKYTVDALRGIYIDLRDTRSGKQPTSKWAALWDEFQLEGGQTGFRDMFRTSKDRAEDIEREFKKVSEGKAKQFGRAIFDWLSDYNSAMENAVRLAAYKVAKDTGMSNQRAASLAKNLTVNFNRKGQVGVQVGALYAFFNASVQGTARMAETLAGPMGKKIITGGVLLGAMQALLLAAAGFDDDEPPDFVRERNIIIPIGDKKYLTIPMPLGFHALHNIGRIPMEFTLSGFRDPGKRMMQFINVFADTFNPIGNAGFSLQTIAPSAIDPIAALAENKDWTGKPITREDFRSLSPTPGHTRAKDTASAFSKATSQALNWLSGGTQYKPGIFSPTPDQIDYLIGVVTGGLGREGLKVEQTISSAFSGEDLPPYKIPLFGRFYGSAEGQSAQGGAFYSNLKAINEHEAEIKGRKLAGEPIGNYLIENPEARLYKLADHTERQVSKLRKLKREMVERGDEREAIKAVDERITQAMLSFNNRVRSIKN